MTKRKTKPYNMNPKPSDFPVRSNPTREYGETAANMAKHNAEFKAACAKASEALGKTIEPTKRQAAKYRMKYGAAYKYRNN